MSEATPSAARPLPQVAFRLSLLLPGLGLVYAGAPLRGAAIFAVALLAGGGLADAVNFSATRPEYLLYGVLAAAVLACAWWGGAVHARAYAGRRTDWPPLYRFFARPDVRATLCAARVELIMALVLGALCIAHLVHAAPTRWLPESPRYWFLYEVFAAAFIATFHSLKGSRVAAFLVVTLLATLALGAFTAVPKETLVFAYLLALPACLNDLRARGNEAARLHWMRFWICLFSGYLALFGYGLLVTAWEIVSGQAQYRMRLAIDENVAFAAFGMVYYATRAGFEMLIHLSPPQAESRDA